MDIALGNALFFCRLEERVKVRYVRVHAAVRDLTGVRSTEVLGA
jgi:hypothetical protein